MIDVLGAVDDVLGPLNAESTSWSHISSSILQQLVDNYLHLNGPGNLKQVIIDILTNYKIQH